MATCSALGVLLLLKVPGIALDKKLLWVSPCSVEAGDQSLSSVCGLGGQSLGRECSLWDHPQGLLLLNSPRSQNTVAASPLPIPEQKSRIRIHPERRPRHRPLCAPLDKKWGLLPVPRALEVFLTWQMLQHPSSHRFPAAFLILKPSSGWTRWKILVFTINIIYITFLGRCFLF